VRFGKCVAISAVAETAAGLLGRLVVDKTGLSGLWTYQLAFARPEPLPPGRERDPADQENVPVFATALQEQLGLKLEPTRGPVDVLVIDSVQQPTEN
ncbi:MAG: TIGR03435 family protein, partial [Longimicrobiales bacterium]